MKTKSLLMVCGVIAMSGTAAVSYAQRAGERGGRPGGFGGGHVAAPAPHVEAPRGGGVERSFHGSIRHEDTHVYRAPEIRHEEPRHEEVRHEPNVIVRGGPDRGYFTHHDVHVDVGGHHWWHDFHPGHILNALPFGWLSFNIGGSPYYYYGGTYYQQVPNGYEEVYPPVGAALPAPPDGAYPVVAPNGQTFYYAGGAFYFQQPDGTFISVQPPLGIVVPELPPGAVQVNVNGIVAYQFNGVYYQPVFANGVTQYQTFAP